MVPVQPQPAALVVPVQLAVAAFKKANYEPAIADARAARSASSLPLPSDLPLPHERWPPLRLSTLLLASDQLIMADATTCSRYARGRPSCRLWQGASRS